MSTKVQEPDVLTGKTPEISEYEEKIYTASQWQLIWRRFRRHRLAMIGGAILLVMYFLAIFAPFITPYGANQKFKQNLYNPPTPIHIVDAEGNLDRPFIYGMKVERNPVTLAKEYKVDTETKHYLQFFSQGEPYEMWGIIESDVHLFTTSEDAPIFLMGTDELGQDMFSRVIYAGQISLSIGLVGIAISFILGCLIGGVSGYYGGRIDMIIQRGIEFLISIPTLPLWMALSAALPRTWTQIQTYFAITVILALAGWTGLARVVRGKIMSIRNETFVKAAELAGASRLRIIAKHLLPNFASYLIVNVTMSIPGMILGETSLSFLGLGLQPPVVSWGVLLNSAQNVRTVAQYPWLLAPVFFVVIVVLAFNFLGDGLRDAADPYKDL
jgi:peptide/nickel transport system permease protein